MALEPIQSVMRFPVWGLTAVLAALWLPGSVGSLRAQSLADIAKQEEERRKAVKQAAAKVYTNKDLRGVPQATAATPVDPAKPAAGDTAPPASGEAGKGAQPGPEKNPEKGPEKGPETGSEKGKDKKDADTKGKDRAYWSGRLQNLKAQLDRDQTFADALQSRINALTADFVARDDPAQKAMIARDKQKAIDELSRLKQTIQNDKKAIADLEEEARRANVPPGWLRS